MFDESFESIRLASDESSCQLRFALPVQTTIVACLHQNRRVNHGLDLRRVKQGIVDQARFDGAQNALLVLRRHTRRDDFDAERTQSGRLFDLFCR